MEKLTLLATILAVVLLVANAYAVRTTITTVEIEDGKDRSQRGCREQIQRQDLSHCERFIRHGPRTTVLMMPGEQNQARGSSLQQCCNQVRELDDQCQCEALKQIVRQEQQQQQQGQQQQEQEQEETMVRRAQTIPTYCRLPQRCEWRSVWY